MVLENATVRAAALSSLAKFGSAAPALRPRILVLIKRALYDNDDEVSGGGEERLAWVGGWVRACVRVCT